MTSAVRRREGGTPLNRSIDQAARMLGLFRPERPEMTLADITVEMGATRATAHRHAMALRRAGLLRYDASRQLYSLGPRVVELAAAALAGLRIIEVAGPFMDRLMSDVNETVVLSVWDGGSPVVVRTEDNTERIARIVVRTGARLPADSAQGKVFAAFGDAAAPSPSVEEPELERIRATRLAINSQVVQGIRAMATPVFQETELAGALAIVGTTASVPDDPACPIAVSLCETAELLSAELGFLPDGRTRTEEGATQR